MAKCRVIARNLYLGKKIEGQPLTLVESKIGDVLEYSGARPAAWSGKVEDIEESAPAPKVSARKLETSNKGK